MERLQAFKFELQPTARQRGIMQCFAGACRYVFNKALNVQQERHANGEIKLSYAALCKLLTGWRASAATPWLREAPAQPLQQALKDLERAYDNFFAKRAAFPRFKRKGRHNSFRYPQPEQIKLDQPNGRLFLPKLGWLRYRVSRTVLGDIRNVTVSQQAGRWFVSIQTAREVMPPSPKGGSIGIDMGIIRFATMSDGDYVHPLNSFRRHESALHKAQQSLNRKQQYGSNWKKARARPAHPRTHRECPSRLFAQGHDRDLQQPRDYLHRGFACAPDVALGTG